jgi:hypothetical protein
VQAALTLLLVLFGGVGLRTLLNPGYVRYPSHDISPSKTIAYVEERSTSPGAPVLDDEAELRSLRAYLKPYPESHPEAEASSLPPIVVPRDAPPNVFSPEGRALRSELSWWRLAVEEQNRLHSGPYPWYR